MHKISMDYMKDGNEIAVQLNVQDGKHWFRKHILFWYFRSIKGVIYHFFHFHPTIKLIDSFIFNLSFIQGLLEEKYFFVGLQWMSEPWIHVELMQGWHLVWHHTNQGR